MTAIKSWMLSQMLSDLKKVKFHQVVSKIVKLQHCSKIPKEILIMLENEVMTTVSETIPGQEWIQQKMWPLLRRYSCWRCGCLGGWSGACFPGKFWNSRTFKMLFPTILSVFSHRKIGTEWDTICI